MISGICDIFIMSSTTANEYMSDTSSLDASPVEKNLHFQDPLSPRLSHGPESREGLLDKTNCVLGNGYHLQ